MNLIFRAAQRFGLVLIISLFLVACTEEPESGSSCFDDDECGDMSCYCIRGDGEIPGVCNMGCDSDEDCTPLDDRLSCVEEFCTGTNVCLRTGEE